MKVVQIEYDEFQKLVNEVASLKALLLSFAPNKVNPEPLYNTGFIYIEDALYKYKISRTTINKKMKKYKIPKKKRGKRVLVNEDALIASLEKKEPAPKFNKQKAA